MASRSSSHSSQDRSPFAAEVVEFLLEFHRVRLGIAERFGLHGLLAGVADILLASALGFDFRPTVLTAITR